MVLGEQIARTTPFSEHVTEHLNTLKPLIEDKDVNSDLLARLPEVIQSLSQFNVTRFLEQAFSDAKRKTGHIGPSDIVRNGITFGLQTTSDENLLVRLYIPSGIQSETVGKEMGFILRNGLEGIRRKSKSRRLVAKATENPDNNTTFYSSAEIMVRTLAHLTTVNKPFSQPLPTVLTDTQGQPVGFTLAFDRFPEQSKDAEVDVVDRFFDWGETYGLAKSSGKRAMGLYRTLKGINSLPYAEGWGDLKNMLILDNAGEFITFNRIGYRTRKIGFD